MWSWKTIINQDDLEKIRKQQHIDNTLMKTTYNNNCRDFINRYVIDLNTKK